MNGEIRGEYWVRDGQVDFADGDVGDRNHEGIAIDAVCGYYVDAIEKLAEEYGIDAEGLDDGYDGGPDIEKIAQVLGEIHDFLTMGSEEDSNPSRLMSDKQAHAFIMKEIGCDPEAYSILYGGGDAREYVMEHYGWIAVRSNNVELFGYDAHKQQEVANAINDILWEEGDENMDPSQVELSIYDHKTRKSWNVTLEDLEHPTVQQRPAQLPQTTYNKPLFHLTNQKDQEENKFSQPQKSQPNPWSQTAKKVKVIGPGQDLWRGTSEGRFPTFSQWLEQRHGQKPSITDV